MEGHTELLNTQAKIQKEIALSAIKVQEEVRKRIGSALHASVCQLLYGARLNLHMLNEDIKSDPHYKEVERLLSEALTETRDISHRLMPVALERYGLEGAIRLIATQFQDQLQFRFIFRGLYNVRKEHINVSIYRFVQELIFNVVKHAAASTILIKVIVTLEQTNITVRDDGKGTDMSRLISGQGLDDIQSQIRLLGGNFNLIDKNGTEVMITIPNR